MDYTELITLYPVEHEIKAMLSWWCNLTRNLWNNKSPIRIEVNHAIKQFFYAFFVFFGLFAKQCPIPCRLGSNRLLWRFVAMEIFCTGAHTEILHFGSLLRVRARVLGNVPYGSSLTYVKKGQKAWIMVHNMEKFERWLSSWDSSYDKDSFLG